MARPTLVLREALLILILILLLPVIAVAMVAMALRDVLWPAPPGRRH